MKRYGLLLGLCRGRLLLMFNKSFVLWYAREDSNL
jgi:hypothetical protein